LLVDVKFRFHLEGASSYATFPFGGSKFSICHLEGENSIALCNERLVSSQSLPRKFPSSTSTRVEWPVSEHVSAQDRLDTRGGLCCSGVHTKLEPLLSMHLAH
jgi:hypothetical protein